MTPPPADGAQVSPVRKGAITLSVMVAAVMQILDTSVHALVFLGAALGVPKIPLGVDGFRQSGTHRDLYRH